jgi:hypothetical protein
MVEPDDIEKLIEVWRVLEAWTVSMDRLSEYWVAQGEAVAKEEIVKFAGPRMNAQLAHARSLMVEVLEKRDPAIAARLDSMAEDEAVIGYWNGPQYRSIAEQMQQHPDC